jgi:hypothetical protein
MPATAHGISQETFYQWLAIYEKDLPADKAPAAWLKFCQWNKYGN